MTFTVRYRAKSGTVENLEIEAADRPALFAELQARGVSAIRVTEGPAPKARRAPSSARALVAGLVVVLGAVVAYVCLPRGTSAPQEPDPTADKGIAEVTPAKTAKRITEKRRPKTEQKATASIGELPDLPMFKDAPRYGEINGTNLFPRPLFKTREENHIAGLINAKPGSRCPLRGFHPGEEQRYLAALDAPVEFEDIDTPEEREMKQYMIELKKELKERIAEGEKITDIVQAARDELNEMANMRDKLAQKFLLLQKEGTVEEIMSYYKEANGILGEYGLPPLALRSNRRELYQAYLDEKKAQEQPATEQPREEAPQE